MVSSIITPYPRQVGSSSNKLVMTSSLIPLHNHPGVYPQVLSAVLSDAGFDGKSLIGATQDQKVKDQLRKNTER